MNKSLFDIREEFCFVNGYGTNNENEESLRHDDKFSPNAILIYALSDLAQKKIYKTVSNIFT